jgi:hypothetical protein
MGNYGYDPRQSQGQYGYGNPQQIVVAAPAQTSAWACPFCRCQGQAIPAQKISTGSWVVFALLLLFRFPLFWIGLLMKETVVQCPQCFKRAG